MDHNSAIAVLAAVHTVQIVLPFSPVIVAVLVFLGLFIVVRVLMVIFRWVWPF